MKKLRFDKEKYLTLLRTEGLTAALTTLHLDTEPLEFETFEGRAGWQPEMWEDLTEIRQFSRELWDLASVEKSKA